MANFNLQTYMTSALVARVNNWLPLPTSLLKKRNLLHRTCIFKLDFLLRTKDSNFIL